MDNSKYIWLKGEKVYVSEEIYRAYYRPIWRESKNISVRAKTECSLDCLKEKGQEIAFHEMFEEADIEIQLKNRLYIALSKLTDRERHIIEALYFKNKTECAVADEIGISQQLLSYHKKRIINILKKNIQ
jgi:RNA polymerase sigma factor (sigma-70 family)